MAFDGSGALDDQLLGGLLLVESDEAEVLWSVILQLVHWTDDLYYISKLAEEWIRNQDHSSNQLNST